jgi:CheY-like chemotaxis protein
MSARHRRTVLAVGNDRESLATLATALHDAGYRAVTAHTGEVAALLRTFRFALIVADAREAFGDGDGAAGHRETLDSLRTLAGDIPFLAIPARDPADLGALIAAVATDGMRG